MMPKMPNEKIRFVFVINQNYPRLPGLTDTSMDAFGQNVEVAQFFIAAGYLCMCWSPYHMWYRHGLWGHGCWAPLCGRHGLILPVLAARQLLLSRLVPLHIWPVEVKWIQLFNLRFSYHIICYLRFSNL